jgi:hypothetical protein
VILEISVDAAALNQLLPDRHHQKNQLRTIMDEAQTNALNQVKMRAS